MVKVSNNKIEFCGKERRFKRCPNRILRDSNKPIEALQNEAMEKRSEITKKIDEANKKREEAVQLLNIGYKDDSLLEKNQKKADKLVKEAEKIEAEVEESSKDIDDWMADWDKRMTQAYDDMCVTLLEPMEPGEFIENHDSIDMIIVKNLGPFYDMYMSNFSDAKIKQRLRQLIDAEHESNIRQFRSE